MFPGADEVQGQGTLKRSLMRFCLRCGGCFALLFFTFSFASSALAKTPPTIEWKTERLSVTAEQVPLAHILQEVARQTGMEILGLEEFQEPVSVHFSGLSLNEGLQKLHVNSLVVWETLPQGGTRPVLALVFRQGAPSSPEAIPGTAGTQLASEPGNEDGLKEQSGQNLMVMEQPAGEPSDEDDLNERLKALSAFARQGNEEALREAILDPDQTIQAAALELLAKRDRQKAVAFLVDATKSDQSERQLQALQLLHQTDQAEEGTVRSTFAEALADDDVSVKEYAIRALVDRGGLDMIGYLRQAFHDPDPAVRILVIESVSQRDEGRLLLEEALTDDDEMVRSLAAAGLESASSKEP